MFSMLWTRCTFWTNLPSQFFTENMLLFFNIARKPCRWKLLALHGLLGLFTYRTSENFSIFVKSRVAGLFGDTSHMQLSRTTFGLFCYPYSCNGLKDSGCLSSLNFCYVRNFAYRAQISSVRSLFFYFIYSCLIRYDSGFIPFDAMNALNVEFSVLKLYKVCKCSKM